MPRYAHECARCGLKVDVVCKADDRNASKPCADLINKAEHPSCDGQGELKRPEGELEVTAKTAYAWRP